MNIVTGSDKAEMKIRLRESANNLSASAEMMRKIAKPVVSLNVAMGDVKHSPSQKIHTRNVTL